jgi:uncharacterized membrane protein
MKYVVIIAFIVILGSLASALFFMLKGGQTGEGVQVRQKRMARALALRVGFSVLLFICILLAWKFGLIQPTGITPGR